MSDIDKKEMLKQSRKLNKKFPEAKIGFKVKIILPIPSPTGEKKKEFWFVKTDKLEISKSGSYNIWIPDRYKVSTRFGKEYSYCGYMG